ncbi:hypothetical protein CO218_15565 (plasmid) [Lactiplantibacillus plantarum]|nr:hypothetical protein CO218_15565 [Lactiplantibacillus plantarum]MCT3304601.1 hypothetical protein [Lactiplantibacillus pentosus]MCT3258939.1 hypothetical protein [Lactiplantibacillus plantarum]PKX58678.1 hypothetical protein CUR48_09065 [Lactiplantibacillus plantarum]PRO93343.1 hypothetical protein C6Y12_02915 [Lactiplantibacillus pentosus]
MLEVSGNVVTYDNDLVEHVKIIYSLDNLKRDAQYEYPFLSYPKSILSSIVYWLGKYRNATAC